MRSIVVLFFLIVLAACDPMAPQPTPVVVLVSPIPSITPTPRNTDTPTPTLTPMPTLTEVILPSPTPFPCDEDSGRIVEFNDNFSEIARENLRYRVYIPPCYLETEKRFPIAILIHGLSYREQQWEDIGVVTALDQGIRLGVLPPMILVMPYFGSIGQYNQFPPDASYETVILDELLPSIQADFCTIENREYRAIGGISRGGFWAYSIAMRHPDVFGIVGGHSAYFPDNTREIPAQFNPLEIARNSELLPNANLRMYMDNGASDSAGPSQQVLSNRLQERGIAHIYEINLVGEHDNDYWSQHVDEYLQFYGTNWMRGYDDLPSCREPSP